CLCKLNGTGRNACATKATRGLVIAPCGPGKNCPYVVRTHLVHSRGSIPGCTATGGCSVARRRRLRHKLMLGLALVVGSVGLLLGGTVYGYRAYLNSIHTSEAKLYELKQVAILNLPLADSPKSTSADVNSEYRDLAKMVSDVRFVAAIYRQELANTVEGGLDPDGGFQENKLLDQLEAALQKFTLSLNAARVKGGESANRPLRDDPDVRAAYEEARRIGQQLTYTVIEDIKEGNHHSNAILRQSMWIVVAATVQMLAIVLTLLYYF